MGRRGPKRTPTAILAARGSWKASRRVGEPEVEICTPEKPSWLTLEESEVWDGLIPMISFMIAKVDGFTLARYVCTCLAWREAHDARDEKLAKDLSQHLLQLENHFGLTPSARANMAKDIPVRQQKSAKSKFFQGA